MEHVLEELNMEKILEWQAYYIEININLFSNFSLQSKLPLEEEYKNK